ncbi:MAG TPA: DUF4157 domain-containing protein [Kofleriaceae bacterium]|nr:DUF4157 domain-containing protein [Kofleriaceae bacterium]
MAFDHRGSRQGAAGAVDTRSPSASAPGKQTLTQALPVQRKAEGGAAASGETAQAAAQQGVAGAGGPLPHLDQIQRAFGDHDVSGIQAHVGGDASSSSDQLGAQGYATGNHVAFQQAPSLHLAAHEAAHVVQQRAGVQLKSNIGEAGDAYEQNADAVADRVVAGQSAHDLLPSSSGGGVGGAVQRQAIQRKDDPKKKEITDAQVKAALDWVTKSKIGAEAIKEIQGVCGLTKSGTYDEETVKAVYAKQQELQIGADGQAGQTFCQRTGLIFTHTITAATVADKDLDAVKATFPHGVTVAIYPDFEATVSGKDEFKLQADTFAKNQQAVGVSGGAVVIGQACAIKEVGDVIEVVQSIHRGLLQKWQASQPAAGGDAAGAKPADPPEYTKVLNLALFCHGESWGMGLNAKNDFSGGGLHNNKTRDVNPANVEAFVRGLSDAVVKSVRVELFACSTGHDTTRSDYDEWTGHKQGDKAGGDSFGSSMAQAFGPDATVSAHTTVGHTTENYAARVFGKEAGGGTQGITLFDSMYPETFVQSELTRLFPDLSSDDRGARHDSLRDQMWSHFKDAVLEDHQRPQKRYPVPMGQESFTNPDHARQLLYADWKTNWIPDRLKDVKPTPAKKK